MQTLSQEDAQLTFSQLGGPVSRGVSPGSDEARKITVIENGLAILQPFSRHFSRLKNQRKPKPEKE